jgi:hypothetical protein
MPASFDPATFHPQPGRLLVYLLKTPTKVGSIYLPLQHQQNTSMARIVAIGPDIDPALLNEPCIVDDLTGLLIAETPARTYLLYTLDGILALLDLDETPAPTPAPAAACAAEPIVPQGVPHA